MYQLVLRCMQAAGAILPCAGFIIDAPFGKFGWNSSWNVNGVCGRSYTGNLGWMIMECVAPVSTALSFRANARIPSAWSWLMIWLFILHYIHRAIIQPYVNTTRTPLHALVVMSAIAFNAANGFLMGTWLAKGGQSAVHIGAASVGLVLFGVGLGGNIYHDALLRKLRATPPRRGEHVVKGTSCLYRIPYGGLFRWVSYPNYLCECTSVH